MGADIIELPVITKLDIPVERVIRKASEADLDEIVVVGSTKDGDFYFCSNKADGGTVLWLLEGAKMKLLKIGYPEDD